MSDHAIQEGGLICSVCDVCREDMEHKDVRLDCGGAVANGDRFHCAISYRTETSCNTAHVKVIADDVDGAVSLALAQIKADGRRNVCQVDSVDVIPD